MLWRKGTWEIIFTHTFCLLPGPSSMHYQLLSECLAVMWFPWLGRQVSDSFSILWNTWQRDGSCTALLQMHPHNHFFWHSSALLPSLRHPTLLRWELIRRHLLANRAQRRYWCNLITQMITSTNSYLRHIKTGIKMNVLPRDFLALSSFCYLCNFSLDVAGSLLILLPIYVRVPILSVQTHAFPLHGPVRVINNFQTTLFTFLEHRLSS